MKMFLVGVILSLSTFAAAQKADAALVLGGSSVSDTTGTFTGPVIPFGNGAKIQTDHKIFLEGALGVRLLNAHAIALYAELPVAGLPSQQISIFPAGSSIRINTDHMGSVFITPGIRIKFLPGAPISPWASIGGGWARYSLDSGTTESKAALQYGGGIDFKTRVPLLGFRAEVRDFVTGDPSFGFSSNFSESSGLHHHNILVGGGIVLRF
jgi:hypothetical protein